MGDALFGKSLEGSRYKGFIGESYKYVNLHKKGAETQGIDIEKVCGGRSKYKKVKNSCRLYLIERYCIQ